MTFITGVEIAKFRCERIIIELNKANPDIVTAYDDITGLDDPRSMTFSERTDALNNLGKKHFPCTRDCKINGKHITFQIPNIGTEGYVALEYRLDREKRLIHIHSNDNHYDDYYISINHYRFLIHVIYHADSKTFEYGAQIPYFGCNRGH